MNRSTLATFALGAILACAPAVAGAQDMSGGAMGGGMMPMGTRHAELGTIASVQGSSLTLADGRTVFLHQGTVIHPTGTTLQAGMRIAATGDRDGYKRFNASLIDLAGTRGYRRIRDRVRSGNSMFMGGMGY
jgi:hypothetical protein